jgi:tetratricopeptide (TPR) repeat protein
VAVPPLSGTGASGLAGIYLSTGSALSVLGDHQAAMERFSKALLVPESDRVGVRLAISELMVQQGHAEDAQRQIALGLMEAEAGETQPATGEQLIEAADIFRSLHNYELSQNYLDRAQAAGAADTSVRLGRANNYIAMGDTARAQGELAGISRDAESDPDYQFLLLEANVLRQQHQSAQALTAFAQAADAAGEDQTAEENLLLAGGDEGLRVNQRVSLLGDFSVSPIFEDTTVYVLDSKLDGPAPVPPTNAAQLPLPRSSIQTEGTAAYHLHVNRVPTVSGFFQVRNARGTISIPATNSIANRDTTDYSFNVGVNPTVHLGRNVITFNSGVQATIRRDAISPAALNQNLFREFTYASTSSFFNVVSASGYVLHESGPFTDTNLHSSMLAGALDFRVGAPWGKTALVTGWAASDQKFTPVSIENYYTSSYIGLERKFTPRLNVRAVFEDLRAWRTVDTRSGISQAIRPAGVVDFFPARGWRVEVSSAYNRTQGFHSYDAVQNGFSVSYGIPFRREFKDQGREVPLQYPIRFSGGMQEESFFNFPGSHQQQLRPYFSISLF